MLRFDNPATRAARQQRDKLAAVRLLMDGFPRNCQLCYEHNESVTVDEQPYSFKGRRYNSSIYAFKTKQIWTQVLSARR